ncbi:MAG: hypothetical protein QM778_17340 [Myxococcales bacterium]
MDNAPVAPPPEAFVPVLARRMRDARLLWVNWSLLRDLELGLPSDGITPELEHIFLEAFAYRIPDDQDEPGMFIGEARAFYADRYGGEGIGANRGSGRAAALGSLQIKGIGTTSLADHGSPHDHRHGGLFLGDAMREAVWGELNQAEAPHGANRVLAILDCGTSMLLPDGRSKRRALLLRPFPVRPAHFMLNPYSRQDADSLRSLQQCIMAALPRNTPEPASCEEALREGFLQFADRLAEQQAALLVRRAPHGALSSSNVETSGRLLDFETQSTQPNHGSTIAVRGSPFRSDSPANLSDMLRNLAHCTALGLSPRLAAAIPEREELEQRVKRKYAQAVIRGLLRLCGFPQFWLARCTPSKFYGQLGLHLHQVAFDGTSPILIERRMPRWTGTYDLGGILCLLARLWPRGREALNQVLLGGAQDERIRDLIDAYARYREELDARATNSEIERAELQELTFRLAVIRNEKRPELYLPQLLRRHVPLLRQYAESGDRALISDRIEGLIASNRRHFEDSAELCVLRSWDDRSSGLRIRYLFEPGQGYAIDVAVPHEFSGVSAFGQRLSLERGGELAVSVGRPGSSTTRATHVRCERLEKGFTARVPIGSDLVNASNPPSLKCGRGCDWAPSVAHGTRSEPAPNRQTSKSRAAYRKESRAMHVVLVRAKREAFDALVEAGHEVTLLYEAWQEPWVSALRPRARHFCAIDTLTSVESLWSALHQVGALARPIGAVVSNCETGVVSSAILARLLGIRGLDPEVALRCRDKPVQKAAWHEAGIPTARFVVVPDACASPDIVLASVRTAGLRPPFVLKPVAGYGTRHVQFVSDDEALVSAVSTTVANYPNLRRLMVEEFVAGDEWHFDGVVLQGQLHTFHASRYVTPILEIKNGKQHASISFPPSRHPQLYQAAGTFTQRALDALGHVTGVFHFEVFARPGTFDFVAGELAARVAGNNISSMIERAVGVDLWAAGALSITGDAIPRRPCEPNKVFGVTTLPASAGRINRVGCEDIRALPGVVEATLTVPVGQTMADMRESSTTCIGVAVVEAVDQEQCTDLMASLQRRVSRLNEAAPALAAEASAP